jgi:hypothetical protein
VGVVTDDLLGEADRVRLVDRALAEVAAPAGQVAEQVVDKALAVGPHPVNRAARHPGPLDDLLKPQVLDGERGPGLEGELTPGIQHPLPDLFRRYPLRPGRHGRAHLSLLFVRSPSQSNGTVQKYRG